MNLMEFGMNTLLYANEKNCFKNFVTKFNEYFGLPSDNVTATKNELLIYSLMTSKKEYKEWAKNEFINMLQTNQVVIRESMDTTNVVPKIITDTTLEQLIND